MLEDKALFGKIKSGNETAFDALFRRYHRYLVSISYSYTGDIELSRDLSQEVFLDLWKRRKQIEISSSLKSFLRRAVINLSMSKMKSKKLFTDLQDNKLIVESPQQSNILVEYNELRDKLNDLINSLPTRCKEVFEMSRIENKSHKEIAEALKISTKTIENQMTKALKILRNGLKEADLISLILGYLTILGASIL